MRQGTTRFLTDQLQAYAESWQNDHDDALACWELEGRIKIALVLFGMIRDLDERLAKDPGVASATSNPSLSAELRKLYLQWERPTPHIAAQLKALWAKGFKVEGGDEFKDAVLDARCLLRISTDQLDESARQLTDGKRRTMAEVADGVRRRLGA